MLAQGLVLGVLGAGTGLLAGAAATVLGVPLWQRLTGQLIEDLRFGWGGLATAAAVGVLACVVAATGPAFAVARMRPVDAVAGRFRVAAPTARLPVPGVAVTLAGMVAVVAVGLLGRDRLAAHREAYERYPYVPPLDPTPPTIAILVGVVVAVAGLLSVVPALVTAVGRLGDRLPLAGRLAVRDAVRHRHRTVAAGAAVMVTVAGSVVAAFLFAARVDSEPKTLPHHTALAVLDGVGKTGPAADGARQLERAGTNASRAVPGAVVRDVVLVAGRLPSPPFPAPIFLSESGAGPGCHGSATGLGVGTPELIELVTGRPPDAGMRSALAEGEVVVGGDCLLREDGTVVLETNLAGPIAMPAYRAPQVPEVARYTSYLPTAFISAEAAAAHGWHPYTDLVAITYPATADLDAVRTAVEDAGVDLYASEPAGGHLTGLYLALAGLAGLAGLVGAGVTVALSAADGRADLATLAALGAPPRRRRVLAAGQALVVTGWGTLAGVVLGTCAGFAAVPVAGLTTLSVPWSHLAATALAVPLLAAVVAVLATPSRPARRS